ncbi:hypothetical protein MKW94_013585 [Papaver nudicaule]|uniref:Uncharacterized protein n=1 Tax=Papaver nudicaule TaxID=74823 RepID=A0AA42AX70_PAPNU|nr:hypothetical protein [Papaver nudicaule]
MKLEETSLTNYLLINLAPLTKADPAILAKYVTALLKKEKPIEELKKFCVENLVDFLGNGTELFVSELFKAIDKGSIVTLPDKLDVIEQVGVSLYLPTATKDLPRDPKLRNASIKTGCSSSDHNLEKQGSEDDGFTRKHRKIETRPQSKEASGDDNCKLQHCRKDTRSQSKEAREAFARKLKHCTDEVALKEDDLKRKHSRRETHSQSKEALKDDDRRRKRSRREPHSHSKRVRKGHKRKRHRRDTHSQSLDKDVAWQYLERPNTVRSEVHKNGKRLLGSDLPSSDNLKTEDSDSSRNTTEINAKPPSPAPSSESLKDDSSKTAEINGEHPNPASSPTSSWDLEMRSKVKPSPCAGACSDFSTGLGCNPFDRKLERTTGHWSQHHSRFSEHVFQDRELQTREIVPWMPKGIPYGFHPQSSTPGLPVNQAMPMDAFNPCGWQRRTLGPPVNEGMPRDAFHPFSWRSTLGPPMSHAPATGMPRNHCRDFEELGFCLKGDVCLMDHGLDRIIVEDVQSLSQLNLPVSLSRTNFMRRRARTTHLDSGYPPSGAGAVDLYDPDQRPWSKAYSESSNALIVKRTSPQKTSRTLYVSYIPPKENKIEPLLSHFQKFGAVDDIFITTDRRKAYIQFSKREAAEAAISSPDAVLGNRFIRLSWAFKDRLLELDESSSSTPHLSPQTSLASRQEDLTFGLQEVDDEPHKLGSSSEKKIGSWELYTKEPRLKLKLIDQNQSDFKPEEVASSSQKKIGSSKLFTKEPRLKLELIDQNQSDFKPEEQVILVKIEEITDIAVEKHEVGSVPKAATEIPTNLVNSGCQQANNKAKLKDLSDAKILAETVIPPGLSLPPSSIIRLTCNVASQATTSTDMEKLVAQRNMNEKCQNLNIVQ